MKQSTIFKLTFLTVMFFFKIIVELLYCYDMKCKISQDQFFIHFLGVGFGIWGYGEWGKYSTRSWHFFASCKQSKLWKILEAFFAQRGVLGTKGFSTFRGGAIARILKTKKNYVLRGDRPVYFGP